MPETGRPSSRPGTGSATRMSDFNPYLPISEALRVRSTFAERRRWCDANLPRLAVGSGRAVYAIDDHAVVKLARNAKGIAQNTVESDWGMHDMYGDVLTHLYDADEDARWIIVERAKKIGKVRFRQITGLAFDLLAAYVHKHDMESRYGYSKSPLAPPIPYWSKSAELYAQTDDHPFVRRIVSLIGDFDMPTGDIQRISSYGEVQRDGQPIVVLVDYGLTEDVYKTHYDPRRLTVQARQPV